MKVSVSMYSFHSVIQKEKWSVLDFCGHAETLNLDGVELLDFYWKNKEKELPEVVDYLKGSSLAVSCYDASNDFVKETFEERQSEIQKVKDAVDTAKQLGAPCVRTFCGDLKPGMNYSVAKDWIISSLKECAKYAESDGVVLAIENHGLLAGKSEQVKEILGEVGSSAVKSTFDTGNFLLVEDDPLSAYENLKADIAHVHFKDFKKRTEADGVKGFKGLGETYWIGVIPGDGEVKLSEIISNLKRDQVNTWLSLEYEGYDDPKVAVRDSVDRIKKLLAGQEVK
ncbi:sugar phosphate isomerase/epimerase family protein [Fictibacillus phosphorivorans]|uniref:sugar phosphate isomerase/epimerase family protein n=1 Tax=Fictibacillus phosphorivorans TaxID=1221500 RepID=UPI00203ACB9A|nr:sugar phosphate isomerase/epimerase family protein [Fictibacillus phosphorivorans]MCM3718550.1 sugar phosphate isomerase/epimerase [Fictibacillus phosphorivorans]MCM3776094.1 sugar phosphate isomerase/epimerase [Fictibacillus phosphorivorans]